MVDLPAGPINHHWTKNLIASPDGSKLYVTVGSNSNVAEHGMEAEEGRAAIWEVDLASGTHAHLRHPACATRTAWPGSHGAAQLWTVVNERDELGSDLVPDYLTSVRDGGFYGWPYSYFGQHVDERVSRSGRTWWPGRSRPTTRWAPHTASLGLASSRRHHACRTAFTNGMFIGQHGSWNRRPHSGYKVIFVPFERQAGRCHRSTC